MPWKINRLNDKSELIRTEDIPDGTEVDVTPEGHPGKVIFDAYRERHVDQGIGMLTETETGITIVRSDGNPSDGLREIKVWNAFSVIAATGARVDGHYLHPQEGKPFTPPLTNMFDALESAPRVAKER